MTGWHASGLINPLKPTVGFRGRDGQVFEIASVVLFHQKARLPVIAALNDVLENTRQGKTGFFEARSTSS